MREVDHFDESETMEAIESDSKNELREYALARMEEFWLRGLRMLAVQKKVRCLSFDCFLLAIGHGDMIGMQSAVEVAKKYFVTKAAATECIDDFQKALKIDPMPGQRGNNGRAAMAEARGNQLKVKPNKK